MSDRVPIKQAPGFLRDKKTGAVINTDTAGYELILEKRKNQQENDQMKDEIRELRNLIEQLTRRSQDS